MRIATGLLLSVLFAFGFGCTGMKSITENDPLFVGNEVIAKNASKKIRRVIDEAEKKIQPRPNNTFLWMRPAVARFNMLF